MCTVEESCKGEVDEPFYPSSDTIATICYTSGTTGNPKGKGTDTSQHAQSQLQHAIGVVLTHGNIANAVYAQMHGMDFTDAPVSQAFLPLAHIYGVSNGQSQI